MREWTLAMAVALYAILPGRVAYAQEENAPRRIDVDFRLLPDVLPADGEIIREARGKALVCISFGHLFSGKPAGDQKRLDSPFGNGISAEDGWISARFGFYAETELNLELVKPNISFVGQGEVRLRPRLQDGKFVIADQDLVIHLDVKGDNFGGKLAGLIGAGGEINKLAKTNIRGEADKFLSELNKYLDDLAKKSQFRELVNSTSLVISPSRVSFVFGPVKRTLLVLDLVTGESRGIGTGVAWFNTQGMTALGKDLYIVQDDVLHKVDPETGKYRKLGDTRWFDFQGMVGLGDNLYIVQGNILHEVSPETGKYRKIGDINWFDFQGITALDNKLYIMQRNVLHEVSPKDGKYQRLSPSYTFKKTEGLAAMGSHLYLVQGGVLHRFTPAEARADKALARLGDTDWKGSSAIAAADGNLLILQNGVLHKVSPDKGTYQVYRKETWANAKLVILGPRHAYLIRN